MNACQSHGTDTMLQIFRLAFVCLSLIFGTAVARNGCRQCTGSIKLNFKNYVSLYELSTYLDGSLGRCATGKQYDRTLIAEYGCMTANYEVICKNWNIGLKVWRYCGNGGKVSLRQDNVCVGNICVSLDQLELKCSKSVDCKETCDCDLCGC